MQDLAPAKSNRTKGGATTLKKGGRASLLGSRRFLQEQHPFSDSTYLCTYGLAFLARPGLQDETQVSREKSRTRLARSRSKTKLYRKHNGLSIGHYHLVRALPNGNVDEEPPRHGKWSGRRVPVETSADNNDGDLRQTGVT